MQIEGWRESCKHQAGGKTPVSKAEEPGGGFLVKRILRVGRELATLFYSSLERGVLWANEDEWEGTVHTDCFCCCCLLLISKYNIIN